jgi:outer membrane protein assembly factor BamA
MRDETLMPSTGHLIRLSQEYAGLGGDVNHVRQELEAQIARSNNSGYVRIAQDDTFFLLESRLEQAGEI